MTQEEKQAIINAVLQQIKAQSSDITELPTATSLDNVKSLPAMQGSSLVSAPLSLLIQGISFKNEAIYDLGIVAGFNAASTKAAERTITEDAKVHIILWRSADGNRGDSSTIIQSRWGNYYVIQVMMFVGQEHSCRYRLITTGGNYSVGEWNDLIIPVSASFDATTREIKYNGIRPNSAKTLLTLPVAGTNKFGVVKIGNGLRSNAKNNTIELDIDNGLRFDNGKLTVDIGNGLCYGIDTSDKGKIHVNLGTGLAFNGDGELCAKAGEGITFDGNGGIALNIGTDTDKYKGLRFNEGSRTIGVNAGKGLTFERYELVLNLAEEGGLVLDGDKLKIKEGWRPVPQGKRSATPEDNCFVYATDDPESKSSVLNAPDTLLKQKDGHLMFQKGMWNPNGEAIFYTRNQVPVATESCDGVMSSDDKRNLNKMLNPYNGSGLANLGNGICISTGAGITINANNELVLTLADNGGLVINNDAQLTIDVPKLKEMLGLN